MEIISAALVDFYKSTSFAIFDWRSGVMILVALLFMYLAIKKGFEPLLLVPISFGMLLVNIPGSGVMADPILAFDEEGHTVVKEIGGMLYYLYQGDHLGVFPPLMFLGIGAMTDFGPVLANPKSLILGGAAQFGVFIALWGALMLDEYVPAVSFNFAEAASIGIIGGADGPTVRQTGSALDGPDCSCCVFLYGYGADYSAACYESFDHQSSASDCYEATETG